MSGSGSFNQSFNQDFTYTGSSSTQFECFSPSAFVGFKVFNLKVQLKTAKTEEEFSLSSLEGKMMNVVML